MNPIDFEAFAAFFKNQVGREFEAIGGKSKFVLQNISDHAFYYQLPDEKIRKQNLRYVKRVLEQYAKIQSRNPGHYANITDNGPYILGLIDYYEKRNGRE